jgi:hypothetical protein
MTDRFLFLASRFLWPIHNLVVVAAMGISFGQRGLADYTYALALCSPLYFLAGYSFPIAALLESRNGIYSGTLYWFRIGSALATIPLLVSASLFIHSTQANVVSAVWLVKVGEILFDPLPAMIGARSSELQRGRRLIMLDVTRVAIAQALLWLAVLGANWGIVRTIALVGVCSVAVSMSMLAIVPTWNRNEGRQERANVMLNLFARATPMTASGALLALLVNLARLLAEPHLSEGERAMFGVAQVLGTGTAVLFNSIWLYELHRIRSHLASAQPWLAMRTNVLLSGLFFAALAAGTLVLALVQAPLFQALGITAEPTAALPVLFAALGLQHCISVYRDALKFTGQQWREVQTIVLALSVATATYYASVYGSGAHWLAGVVAMCVAASAVQLALSIFWVRRYGHDRVATADREPA